MEIVVVGCGRVGAELAFRLFQKGHQVTVIDNVDAAFQNLHPDFRGRTVEGEVLNEDVLRRAGLANADGLAAVTSSDTLNVAIAHIARRVYNIPNVVARNYDAHWRILHETFGLQVVSSTSWGAQRIEELLYHQEMRTVFSAGNGEVEIYEFTVPKKWDGRLLDELLSDEGCIVSALTRAGSAVLPDRNTRLHSGDIVLVSATFDGIEKLRQTLDLTLEV